MSDADMSTAAVAEAGRARRGLSGRALGLIAIAAVVLFSVALFLVGESMTAQGYSKADLARPALLLQMKRECLEAKRRALRAEVKRAQGGLPGRGLARKLVRDWLEQKRGELAQTELCRPEDLELSRKSVLRGKIDWRDVGGERTCRLMREPLRPGDPLYRVEGVAGGDFDALPCRFSLFSFYVVNRRLGHPGIDPSADVYVVSWE